MPEYIERESAKQVFASQNKSLQAACYSIIDSISAADRPARDKIREAALTLKEMADEIEDKEATE